jgi:hypothetical protein
VRTQREEIVQIDRQTDEQTDRQTDRWETDNIQSWWQLNEG